MNCLKCGREIEEGQVFCNDCLVQMAKYPVKPEVVTEDNMILLARDVAKKIESELEYPGQIKVNVIRETKAVEYAK